MLSRLAGEIPRFFTPQKLVLLLEAMGTTLGMTAIGCVLGFGLAFGIVILRQTPGRLALPLRLAAVFYVEIFRRIPFLVVIYLVLFFIQAFVSDASLFAIAVIAICIYSTAYTADIIRGGLESVAPAGRGGGRDELQPLADPGFGDRAAILAGHPAAGGRLRGRLHQGYRAGLPGRRVRAHLPRQGAQ